MVRSFTHKILLSILGITLAMSISILLVISFSEPDASSLVTSTPEEKKKTEVPLFVTDILTAEQNAAVKAGLIAGIHEAGPTHALEELARRMEASPGTLRVCHALVHEIGRESYRMYQDFPKALIFENDVCGSGYLHGVIEARFENVSDIFGEIKTICNEYTSPTSVGKCYHGVGHGLMYYTKNHLPDSIALCDTFDTAEKKIRCGEGVFMENFSSNQVMHISEYLDPQNPLYPCPEQSDLYKGTCYYYAPLYYLTLHEDAYTQALEWCATAESGFRATCARGVGSRIMKQHIAEPNFVEKACMTGPSNLVDFCLDGMVSYHLVNFDSVRKTKAMCRVLLPIHHENCLQSVENRRGIFAD